VTLFRNTHHASRNSTTIHSTDRNRHHVTIIRTDLCLIPTAPSPKSRRCFSAALPNTWGAASTRASTSQSPDTPTPRACAPMCSARCASRSTRPSATPAATSSAATTGSTASAPRSSARAAANWPGNRWRPTSLAPTSSWASARPSTPRRCWASTWAPARSRPLRPGRLLQHALRHLLRRPARQARLRRAAQCQVLVRRQRDGRPLADGPPGGARIRRQGARGRQAHALDGPVDPDHPLRLVQRPHAHLPGMGSGGAGRGVGAHGLPLDALLRRQPRERHASFLASAVVFEHFVDTLDGVLRYVKAKNRSKHDVYLSWDEWQVWYKGDPMQGNWTEAPHLVKRPTTWRMRWSWRSGSTSSCARAMCSRSPASPRSSTSSPG
jgi:hypothetical protein